MASLLYRIGRWAADHRWSTIVVWFVLIALVATGAATFSRPLTDDFTIEGSRFQEVLEALEEEIPDASGTIGTVAFATEEGFTDEQRDGVVDLLDEWAALDGVVEATDPFAMQADLDDTRDQLEEGRAELEEGRAQLAAGREEVEAQAQELAQARTELEEGRAELEQQRQELAAMAGQLPPGELAQAEQELAAGQAELEAAEGELAAGEEQIAEARAELDASEEELAAAETELEQGERLADVTEGARQVSEGGAVAMAQIRFDAANGGNLDPELTQEVQEIGDRLVPDGVQLDFSTEITADLDSLIGPSEVLGVLFAGVVLFIMLGSVLAAGLPLVNALVGVAVGLGAAMTVSAVVEMTSVTPVLALMLGLAVGIDYSLFIVNRHRVQLAEGMEIRESIARATGTAGNAVVFAGITNVIALAALALTGMEFLGVMGVVAAGTVTFTVLVSITFTPAVLSLLGGRVLPARQRRRLEKKNDDDGGRGWAAWVQRRPWLVIVGVVVIGGALAIPAPQLRLGLPDGSQDPPDSTAYRTFDLIREHFGAGANGPLIGVASLDEPAQDQTALTEVQLDIAEDLAGNAEVDHVLPVGTNDARDFLAFQIVPQAGPADQATVELVDELRAQADELGAAHGAELGFTGLTVANIDISQQLREAMPLYLLVVVGLSLVILILVFRSIWVPLLASAGFLASVFATIGGVVAVYQLGHLSWLFDVNEAGPVLSFLPIVLIGVLFGLAMDYQMFLVSAMREVYTHGASARAAVVRGFNISARVVTAAAIIMVSVFAGFVYADLTMVRPIGFGLALGILLDAFLVRMTLTPAVLSLLGDKAWWLPGWLDRILPNVDVEGARLEHQLERAETE